MRGDERGVSSKGVAAALILALPALGAAQSHKPQAVQASDQGQKTSASDGWGEVMDRELREDRRLAGLRENVRLLGDFEFGGGFVEFDVKTAPGEKLDAGGGGPEATLGASARYAISPRFDLQSRISLSFMAFSPRCDAGGPNGVECASDTKNDTFMAFTPALDVTARVRPVSATNPWYVGIGPRFGVSLFSGVMHYSWWDRSGYPSVKRTADVGLGSRALFGGVFETGATWGAREQWDMALRVKASQLGATAVVSFGWAFGDIPIPR